MKHFITILLFLSSTRLYAQKTLPVWFLNSFKTLHLNENYELKPWIKPAFLRADFNGDGNNDIAALIINRKTHKKGIVLITGLNHQYVIWGAGMPVGEKGLDGSDNFKWMQGWKVYHNHTAEETTFNKDGDITGATTRRLKNVGISLWQLMDGEPLAGGIISWNGRKWTWTHQGE